MESEQYLTFEKVFQASAYPFLNELKASLEAAGRGPFTDVYEVDLGVERGLGFECQTGSHKFVHLILEDGDDCGYDGLGLRMTCSTYANGLLHTPGSYSATPDAQASSTLKARLEKMMDLVQSYHAAVDVEWAASDHRELGGRELSNETVDNSPCGS